MTRRHGYSRPAVSRAPAHGKRVGPWNKPDAYTRIPLRSPAQTFLCLECTHTMSCERSMARRSRPEPVREERWEKGPPGRRTSSLSPSLRFRLRRLSSRRWASRAGASYNSPRLAGVAKGGAGRKKPATIARAGTTPSGAAPSVFTLVRGLLMVY